MDSFLYNQHENSFSFRTTFVLSVSKVGVYRWLISDPP